MSRSNSLSKSFSLPRRILLGLYLVPSPEGLVIHTIDPSSPAAKTDLQPGDRLKTANGKTISDAITLLDWQRNFQHGQEVLLQVNRQGKGVNVSFCPDVVPFEEAEGANKNEYEDFIINGVRLRSLFTYSSAQENGKLLPGVIIFPGLGGMPCDQPGPGNLARDIAMTLARYGAVVMRYDQRGVGDSEGNIYANVDFYTEVEDARKTLEVLSEHPKCDSQRMYLIGLSLGGAIIPLIAGGNPRVKRVCVWGSLARPWVNYALENSLVQARMRRFPKNQVVNLQNLSCLLWGLLSVTEMKGEELLKSFPAFKEVGLTKNYLNAKTLSFWRQLARTDFVKEYEKCAFRLLALRGEYDVLSHEQDLKSILNAASEAKIKATGSTVSGVDHFCNAGSSQIDCFNRLLQGNLSYQPEKFINLLADWLFNARA